MRYCKSQCRYNGVRLFIKNKTYFYVILSFQSFVKDVYILLELQISYNTLEHGGSKLPETSLPYYQSYSSTFQETVILKKNYLITETNKSVSFL